MATDTPRTLLSDDELGAVRQMRTDIARGTYNAIRGSDVLVLLDIIDRLNEAAARPRDEGLDASRLGMAMDLVDEEDTRVGVVGRGRKADRIVAEYARLREQR